MRERIRILAAACFYYMGLVHLMLWWKQRTRRRLTILNYHRAVGPHIQHQMRFLRRHYRILPLEEALEEFYGGHNAGLMVAGPEKRDQRALLTLTFDDGYLDNYLYAWKLACQLHLPITIFLVPGYVESGAYFWWLADDYLAEHAAVEMVVADGKTYCLKRAADRKALAQFIDLHTRYVTSVAEREQFLCSIQEKLGISLPTRQQCGMSDMSLPLNWSEVHEMAQSGWVSFGAHTMHHPILAYLSDTEELQREVLQCREVLQQQLGKPTRCFCYPVGQMEHIGVHAVEAVKQAGYDWALTTLEGVNTLQTDPYLLARLPGDETQHWLVMAAELAGLLGIMSRLRKKYGKNFKKRSRSDEGRATPQLPPNGTGSTGATSSPSI